MSTQDKEKVIRVGSRKSEVKNMYTSQSQYVCVSVLKYVHSIC